MPADTLLSTVLIAYQGASDAHQKQRILSSTVSLLTTLTNPLNITLLTSHFLQAPAIWDAVDGLYESFRTIGVFHTAAVTVHKHELEGQALRDYTSPPRLEGGIKSDEWVTAVIKGLDDRSPRWKHLLVIAGILVGFKGQEKRSLSRRLRNTLEDAMVTATNLASGQNTRQRSLGLGSVALALSHGFPLLSHRSQRYFNYDQLLPIVVEAMTSAEGFEEWNFLERIDSDVFRVPGNQLDWPANSYSFLHMQKLASKPLIASMGLLSRLIARTIEAASPLQVIRAREHLLMFSDSLWIRWPKVKLSEITRSEESAFLTSDTLRITYPVLWQSLKTAMFASIVVLRAIIGKTLIDSMLSSERHAFVTASQALLILRNLHFISSRLGSNVFSAYNFINFSAIDILTSYPASAISFLRSIYPLWAGQIPGNPLQRNQDLFYLNTVEHFATCLGPADAESLIVKICTPYLSARADGSYLEIFEAAHSAMLCVFATPQNAELTTTAIPVYVESLFASFPEKLGPRQFRFAFKTMMQICTPPNPLSAAQPTIAETLLEVLHQRALYALTIALPTAGATALGDATDTADAPILLSEQAVLLLALLDALPYVALAALEEWLSRAADLLNAIRSHGMKLHCRQCFWSVLESGEMDLQRSAICVTWWGTGGGRERVVGGRRNDVFMSGGLGLRDGSRL